MESLRKVKASCPSADFNGNGKSLTRKVWSDYGNDPDNWTASAPSPGL